MARDDSFLLAPGRLPWRLVQPTRRSRSGVVYDADGRLVCVAALGNAAAMREALENSNGLLEELAAIGEWGESAREQIAENNAALSAPSRQCDVGTAEEQYQRYEKFCCNHYRIADDGSDDCLKCPFSQPVCKLSWAQTPYAAEEGGAS